MGCQPSFRGDRPFLVSVWQSRFMPNPIGLLGRHFALFFFLLLSLFLALTLLFFPAGLPGRDRDRNLHRYVSYHAQVPIWIHESWQKVGNGTYDSITPLCPHG